MRKLEPQIKKNGFHYSLVKRGNNTAIYAQFNKSLQPVLSYEVFQIGIRSSRQMCLKNGTVIEFEASEKFPSNEDFGKTAWTFKTIAPAEAKFFELEFKHAK